MIPVLRRRTPCADKNDRLKWRSGFVVRDSTGYCVGFRSNDVPLLDLLRSTLPADALTEVEQVDRLWSLWRGAESNRKGVKNYHLLYDGWTQVRRDLDFELVRDSFEAMLRYAALRYWDVVFAAGLALPDGDQSALVVADSRLVPQISQLVAKHPPDRQLFSYLVFSSDGRVTPWQQFDTLSGQVPEGNFISQVVVPGVGEPSTLTPGETWVRLFSAVYGDSGENRSKVLGSIVKRAKALQMAPVHLPEWAAQLTRSA